MSRAVCSASTFCDVLGSTYAPKQLCCWQSAYRDFCPKKSLKLSLQGGTRRHAPIWPAKATKTPHKPQGIVSNFQKSHTADKNTLSILNFINDSAKWVVTLAAGSVLLWNHNVDVSWSLLGSIIAVFFCKVLKKVINKQRPKFARKTDPGMPSSHASSLAYLSVYMALAWHPEPRLLASLGLGLAALLIPLRVILGYHSVPQVLVGALLGAASAASWYSLGCQAVLPVLKSSTGRQGLLAAAVVAAVTGYICLAFQKK